MNVVAVICARGGSQGIKNKNVKLFAGKPLIAWTIEQCKASSEISRVIVSTDSDEIAKVALEYGAEVPFRRPSEFATSESGLEPVLRHAYEFLKNTGYKSDYFCLVPVTNPLRTVEQINGCIKMAVNENLDCVMTVSETPANHTPFWTITLEDEVPKFYYTNSLDTPFVRRQDFPQKCYARNDLIYVLKPENLYAEKPTLYGKKVKAYITSALYDGDINSEEDWIICENLFNYLRAKKNN